MMDSLSGDPECNLTTASVENIGNYTTPQPIVLIFKSTYESIIKAYCSFPDLILVITCA